VNIQIPFDLQIVLDNYVILMGRKPYQLSSEEDLDQMLRNYHYYIGERIGRLYCDQLPHKPCDLR
jgi:hypothetical protein